MAIQATSESDIKDLMLCMLGEELPGGYPTNSKDKRVVWCNKIYPQVVKEMFYYAEDWKFCTARKKLARFSATPEFGKYDYYYSTPPAYVRILATIDENEDDINYDYRKEVYIATNTANDVIKKIPVFLSNEENMYVKYIAFIDDPGQWPAWFVKCIYIHGAYLMSLPLTSDKEKQANTFRLLQAAMGQARDANATEDMNTEYNRDVDRGRDSVANAAYLGYEDYITNPRIIER